MIEILIQFDQTLFLLINHLPHNFIFDSFFSLLSGVGKWGIIWFAIAGVLFIREEVKDKRKLISLFLALLISGIIVETGLKNIIRRPRPEIVMPETIIISQLSDSFSFPSGHATIAFAAAYILGKDHKKLRWFYYLLAFLIAFSRVYLGKHYPIDVVGGALLGLVIGKLSLIITIWITRRPISTPEVED